MTLVADIVRSGFREAYLVGEAEFPTPTQGREALMLYNELIASLYGNDVGERLRDWPLGIVGRDDALDWSLPDINILQRPWINSRLIASNAAPMTVYLTPEPQDGSRAGISDPLGNLAAQPVTIDANGRTIGGARTLVLNTASLMQEWMYRMDLSDWVKLGPLLITDTHPFPAEFNMMFRIMLAMRINPRYGSSLMDTTLSVVQGQHKHFVARYVQSQPLQVDDSISWPFMSKQSYTSGRTFTSTGAFNTGRPYGDR